MHRKFHERRKFEYAGPGGDGEKISHLRISDGLADGRSEESEELMCPRLELRSNPEGIVFRIARQVRVHSSTQ